MGQIKFRLLTDGKIAGYEKWYRGKRHLDEHGNFTYCEASPCWLYGIDNEFWNPTLIPHRDKEQFIGLFDKNGNEIYEGDILREGERISVVEWYQEYDCWSLDVVKGGDEPVTRMFTITLIVDRCEIIGNIHENPELLEKITQ